MFRSHASGATFTSTSVLRFIDPSRLRFLLADAGFGISAMYGDWDGSPVGPEIVVIATVPQP